METNIHGCLLLHLHILYFLGARKHCSLISNSLLFFSMWLEPFKCRYHKSDNTKSWLTDLWQSNRGRAYPLSLHTSHRAQLLRRRNRKKKKPRFSNLKPGVRENQLLRLLNSQLMIPASVFHFETGPSREIRQRQKLYNPSPAYCTVRCT